MWLHGRQVYTFSRLFNECDQESAETRKRWLEIATLGIDFLPNGKGFLPGPSGMRACVVVVDEMTASW